jgi:ABC-type amino acid transport system permease subunit
MAMGFTTPQYYRYVLLPMAFRIIIPPLTSEAMNIFKNSSVGVRGVDHRADLLRPAGGRGDLARHRGVHGGHGPVHHLGPGHQPHHGLHREAAPGCRASSPRPGAEGTDMHALDFSFFSWAVFRDYILQGMYFSFILTAIATLGRHPVRHRAGADAPVGQAAAGRGRPPTYVNGMRSIPLLMVLLWFFLLVPFIIGRPIGAELTA